MKWCLISLVLVMLSSGCWGATPLEDTSDNQDSSPRFPCPVPEDIAPCVCSESGYGLKLDCSAVESDSQLADVFKAPFPVKEFYEFWIVDNQAVTELGPGLNGVTFERVYSSNSILERVSDSFILETALTLRRLHFTRTLLNENNVPFGVLEDVPNLEDMIILNTDEFRWIPPFNSQSLRWADFYANNITNLDPGTFDGMPNLIRIILWKNKLTELKSNFITVTPFLTLIDLSENAINVVEPNAFVVQDGVTAGSLELWLNSNSIVELHQEVFGNLFPYLSMLYLYDNPLLCGCDMAWIVANRVYLNKIDSDATCYDGVNVHDLDPAAYAEFC